MEATETKNAITAWEAKTFAFLADRGFAPQGATLVLAVSGGADSLALLEFWARSGARRFRCRLHAVHVHHGLRESADRDQALVEERCRALGIPLQVFRLDPGSRRGGESLEMWGRRERYRCFAEAASDASAKAPGAVASSGVAGASASPAFAPAGALASPATPVWILTGHHRDDLVETVFQRLERGTGARGLAGIPFRRDPGIARPFLDRSRAEIEAYLRLLGRSWCEDESNADLAFGRNWHRHRYLPALRSREPDLDARILALSLAVQEFAGSLDALEAEADLLRRDEAGRPWLPAAAVEERLAERDAAGLHYWIVKLAEASGSTPVAEAAPSVAEAAAVTDRVPSGPCAISPESIRELHRQWSRGTRMLRVPMSPGIWLARRNERFYWEKSPISRSQAAVPEGKKSCSRPGQRIILDNGGATAAWTWCGMDYRLQVRRYPRPAELAFPGSRAGVAIFDADLFSCTLQVRTRKDGDRFSPLGISSESRKLKVFLNEKKIPVGVRDEIPLVFARSPDRAAETLAWVPGHGISHFYKVGPETRTILEMELTCRNP